MKNQPTKRKGANKTKNADIKHAFSSARIAEGTKNSIMNGLIIEKTWRCTKDEKTCDICRAMDGAKALLNEPFDNAVLTSEGIPIRWAYNKDNENGLIANAHVGCRCYFDENVVGMRKNDERKTNAPTYVRQQKGHSIILAILFGWVSLYILPIYWTVSKGHYWHL